MQVEITYPLTGAKEKYILTREAINGLIPQWEYNPFLDLINTLLVLCCEYNIPIAEEGSIPALTELLHAGTLSLVPWNLCKIKSRIEACCRCIGESIVLQNMSLSSPSFQLYQHILEQSYVRAMMEFDGIFRKNKENLRMTRGNFPQLVYGELSFQLIKTILDRFCCDSSITFVDLGSGIGNAILCGAFRCNMSVGIEIQDQFYSFSLAYRRMACERLEMMGYQSFARKIFQNTCFFNGDFTTSPPQFSQMLAEADLVLVNNFTFPPSLNEKLSLLFLDLKVGAKVISLVPFVATRARSRTIPGPDLHRSIFDPVIEKIPYAPEMVSWTAAPGHLYLHTVKK